MHRTLAVSIALCAVAATASASAAERRIATLAPVGSPWMTILEEGAEELRRATDGRIDIKYYGGGVQGDEKDVVRKIRLGQLDGAALTTIGLGQIYPGIRVLSLPFMFESEEEMAYVRDKMWEYFRGKFAERGFHLQAPGGAGWEYVYSDTPIRSLEDWRKVKMWAWSDDPVVKALFERLKLNAVPLSVPDLLGALKTGRVTGCYGPPLAAVALQWYSEVSHVSSAPISYTIGSSVVRMEVWEQISAADQQAETKISRKMAKKVNKRTTRDNDRALKAMAKAGVKLVETSPQLVATLRGEAEKVWADLAGELYSKEELAMALKYRDEFRAKN